MLTIKISFLNLENYVKIIMLLGLTYCWKGSFSSGVKLCVFIRFTYCWKGGFFSGVR